MIVCEVDPMRALEARMDGFEVMPALDAAAPGDVFVTVTGGRDVLTREHFARMKDGAMLANAGHFDVEIAVDELAALADGRRGGVGGGYGGGWTGGGGGGRGRAARGARPAFFKLVRDFEARVPAGAPSLVGAQR